MRLGIVRAETLDRSLHNMPIYRHVLAQDTRSDVSTSMGLYVIGKKWFIFIPATQRRLPLIRNSRGEGNALPTIEMVFSQNKGLENLSFVSY